jgi:hypothetical protein
MRRIINFFCISIILSSCAGNHEGIGMKLSECGMGSARYNVFKECAHNKLGVTAKDPNDYYAKSRQEVLSQIDALDVLVSKKKIKSKQAYGSLAEFMNAKVIEEQQQSQQAAAIFAAMATGVVIASCVNNGGCGGGGGNSYNSYYAGPCECPADLDINGNRCGARSAYTRTGGASPYCPPSRL